MQPFDYVRVDSIAEAASALSRPGSRVLAGGTGLVDLMKLGVERPKRVVDIGGLPLSGIVIEREVMSIGALVSNGDLAADARVKRLFPAVSQAVLSGASGQIRNAASVAGNLLQRTRCGFFRSLDWPCNKRVPGSGCAAMSGSNAHHAVLGVSDACMAVNPSDLAVALLALDAVLVIEGATGLCRVPISQFYRLPGDTPEVETALRPGELITHVEIRATELAASSIYLKLRGRASYEFASASVAAAVAVEDGVVSAVAVALGGLGVMPWRDRAAEGELLGNPLEAASVARFCDAVLATARPTRENAYKIDLARGAIHRSLLS